MWYASGMIDAASTPAEPHGPALARIRRMARSVCEQHTDPAWHEPVPVLVHEMTPASHVQMLVDVIRLAERKATAPASGKKRRRT